MPPAESPEPLDDPPPTARPGEVVAEASLDVVPAVWDVRGTVEVIKIVVTGLFPPVGVCVITVVTTVSGVLVVEVSEVVVGGADVVVGTADELVVVELVLVLVGVSVVEGVVVVGAGADEDGDSEVEVDGVVVGVGVGVGLSDDGVGGSLLFAVVGAGCAVSCQYLEAWWKSSGPPT